jgi:hypothetical protein
LEQQVAEKYEVLKHDDYDDDDDDHQHMVLSIVALCQAMQILKCHPKRFDHSKENFKSHTSFSYGTRCTLACMSC